MEELHNETYLAHYGMPRRSGRYPWGSGEHPFQSAEDFMNFVKESKEDGMSESEIAHTLGLSTNVFRDQRTAAKNEIIANRRAQLIKLTSMGYSVNGACNRMGISEHQGRSLLSDATKSREETSKAIFTEFKRLIDSGYYVDVGQGSEAHLGISTERLRAAVHEAERAGYKLINVRQKQMGTHEKTYMKVLCPPGTELMDVVNNKSKICPPNFKVDKDSNDIVKIEKPRSFPSSRVEVRYAEDGGIDRDGLIQIRRGVPELSLGNAKYAQVRIMIDGTHYLKGMAVYADDLPPGIDIRYNVNKHRGTPKMDCMKPIKDDPENPFGAIIKLDDELIRAQRHYIDKDGKRQLSCLNIVAEEGTWFEWSKSLPSQMLSKQRLPIIKRQLDKSYQAAALRVHELMQVRNPNIRAALAEQIAGQIDSDANNLRAAAYPRQCSQVILPFPELSENEIYAPNFKDGERVALIRYPHGGIFEIPQLTVRNTGSPAAKVIPNALDAVGINPKVAARLSGADFDGDTVTIVPNNEGSVISAPALKELIDFDPKEAFPGTNCDPKDLIPKDTKEGDKLKGLEMGRISNLITDMTLQGAPFSEIARADKHSMVVIDAQKHQLDYKRSAIVNGIEELYIKYHGGPKKGANTIVSKATSKERVPEQREAKGLYEVPEDRKNDWYQGKKIFIPTNQSHYNPKIQKLEPNLMEVNRMSMYEDANELRGIKDPNNKGFYVEEAYADFANKMKALANDCRAMARTAPVYQKRQDMAVKYDNECKIIRAKVADRKSKSPIERRAQILAEADLKMKIKADPSITVDREKYLKESIRSLNRMRAKLAIPDVDIHLSDKEWEAVFNGALDKSIFDYLMRHCDPIELSSHAFEKLDTVVSEERTNMIRQMDKLGYSRAQIGEHTGLSPKIIRDILE